MRFNTVKILMLFLSLFITSCASVIPHKPSEKMSFKDASTIAEELIMTAENNERPGWVKVSDSYMMLGYGSVSDINTNPFGIVSANTRDINERINFKSIKNIELYKANWKQIFLFKFRFGYLVQINLNDDRDIGSNWKVVYRSNNANDAKRLVDALESLMFAYKIRPVEPNKSLNTINPQISPSQKFRDLQTLKNDGLITDEEYQHKRKQLLESL